MLARVLIVVASVLAVACGSSSPSAPSSSTGSSSLTAPTSFVIATQQVTMTSNIISFTWSGSGSTYKMFIGSAAGGSDLVSTDVTGTTYTWTGPRTAGIYYARVAATSGGQTSSASTELPVFTLDMRNMIDALYYNTGPLSQFPTVAPNNSRGAAVFEDGASLTLLVTTESTSASLTNAQQFVSEYLAAAGNPFSVSISSTTSDYKSLSFAALPQYTIIIRVLQDYCSAGAIACAQIGPSPVGLNKSFVTMNGSTGADSIAHEIGHAFGMYHMAVTASARAEFKFLMNPALVASQLSAVEKATIAAARAGGLRQGMTRSEALAANLVLPFTGTSSALAAAMPRLLDDIKSVFSGS